MHASCAIRISSIRSDLVLRAEGDGERAEDALAHADEEGALLAHVRQHVLRLLPLDARVEPRLPLVLVGRRNGAPERDGELGGDERALLVVRDERVQRVEEDLVDEVEADGAVVVLPRLDGDVPHLAPPQERQAVVPDEGLQYGKDRERET